MEQALHIRLPGWLTRVHPMPGLPGLFALCWLVPLHSGHSQTSGGSGCTQALLRCVCYDLSISPAPPGPVEASQAWRRARPLHLSLPRAWTVAVPWQLGWGPSSQGQGPPI